MGRLSKLLEKEKELTTESPFPERLQGRRMWNRIFGDVSRERAEAYAQPPVRGGSYGRSGIAGHEATKRLLQSLRSMAPGGWSDDRWEQTRHLQGITYICNQRSSEVLSESEFQVFRKDPQHPDGKVPIKEGDPA